LRKISNVTQLQITALAPELQAIFNEIFAASNENDTVDIANAFTVSGTFTATRKLNVTAPTLANVVAVLATLIQDMQRAGTNRNT
jgi:hypothetical protein